MSKGVTWAVEVPVAVHPMDVNVSFAQVDAHAGMPLEESKSCEAALFTRNKNAQK